MPWPKSLNVTVVRTGIFYSHQLILVEINVKETMVSYQGDLVCYICVYYLIHLIWVHINFNQLNVPHLHMGVHMDCNARLLDCNIKPFEEAKYK